MQTDEIKEAKRIAALERKAQLYESLQQRVNIDDEAANDQFEVDFIAKALSGTEGARESSGLPLPPPPTATGSLRMSYSPRTIF